MGLFKVTITEGSVTPLTVEFKGLDKAGFACKQITETEFLIDGPIKPKGIKKCATTVEELTDSEHKKLSKKEYEIEVLGG